jgi:antirestriction protein ArdC
VLALELYNAFEVWVDKVEDGFFVIKFLAFKKVQENGAHGQRGKHHLGTS